MSANKDFDDLVAALRNVRSDVGAQLIQEYRIKQDDVIEQRVASRLQAASFTDEMIGWRRLTGENVDRNLDPLSQDRMHDIAFYLWESNPMARWLIEIAKDFILAEGLPYRAVEEEVQDYLDGFWFDPVNRMDLYLEKHVREHLIFGELCLPAFVAEQTGRLRLGYIDTSQIKQVITDPENVKMSIGIALKDTPGYPPRFYRTIVPEEADTVLSREAKEMRRGYTNGECFFSAINNVTNSPRGRSELLTVADWLDNYEQFLFDTSDKWRQINAFVWDLTVQHGDKPTIEEQIKNFVKKAGSVFGHNEMVTAEPLAPTLQAPDFAEGARLFRNHILGPFSYPEHWYGGGGDVNRATAVEMGTPTFKTLSSKQRYFKYVIESILDYQIERGLKSRFLKLPEDRAYDYEVIVPELSVKDVGKYATVIGQVSSSLAVAQDRKWIDRETARQIYGVVINYLGVEVDMEGMKEKVEAEKVEEDYQDYEGEKKRTED
jgi:hypothetical protein